VSEVPLLFADATDMAVRVRESRVLPDYQPGDWVSVREVAEACPGQVVVARFGDGSSALVRWPVEGARVLGVVTGMFRKVD
jgi:SOS-response transcriptional repressor LexA